MKLNVVFDPPSCLLMFKPSGHRCVTDDFVVFCMEIEGSHL